MGKIVLSYNDSCLNSSDLQILKTDNAWLNDKIISFYFEYLQNEILEDDRVLLLGSDVAQAIKMSDNPEEINNIFLNPLSAHAKDFIITAVNDQQKPDSAGGHHWTLLVYSKPENAFFHFDSIKGTNAEACKKLVATLKACLGCSNAQLKEVDSLQQNNSYDCGIYVLSNTDEVIHTIGRVGKIETIKKITPAKVIPKRNELIQIIKDLGGNIE